MYFRRMNDDPRHNGTEGHGRNPAEGNDGYGPHGSPRQPAQHGAPNPYGQQGQPGHPGQPGQQGPYGQQNQASAAGAAEAGDGVSWVSLVAILLIGALLIAGWWFFMKKEPVVVGSCLEESAMSEADGSSSDMPGAVDCDDEAAAYRVLAIGEEPGDVECIDVPGATSVLSLMYADVSTYCLAGVDEDVDRNINDIEVGECVVMEGDTALKVDCGEPGALEVLAIDPEPKMIDPPAIAGQPDTCEKLGAAEYTQYYKWGLPSSGFISVPDYQKGLCMAEVA